MCTCVYPCQRSTWTASACSCCAELILSLHKNAVNASPALIWLTQMDALPEFPTHKHTQRGFAALICQRSRSSNCGVQ
eukprot:1027987-Pelagomonas_calceolata.AAC.3